MYVRCYKDGIQSKPTSGSYFNVHCGGIDSTCVTSLLSDGDTSTTPDRDSGVLERKVCTLCQNDVNDTGYEFVWSDFSGRWALICAKGNKNACTYGWNNGITVTCSPTTPCNSGFIKISKNNYKVCTTGTGGTCTASNGTDALCAKNVTNCDTWLSTNTNYCEVCKSGFTKSDSQGTSCISLSTCTASSGVIQSDEMMGCSCGTATYNRTTLKSSSTTTAYCGINFSGTPCNSIIAPITDNDTNDKIGLCNSCISGYDLYEGGATNTNSCNNNLSTSTYASCVCKQNISNKCSKWNIDTTNNYCVEAENGYVLVNVSDNPTTTGAITNKIIKEIAGCASYNNTSTITNSTCNTCSNNTEYSGLKSTDNTRCIKTSEIVNCCATYSNDGKCNTCKQNDGGSCNTSYSLVVNQCLPLQIEDCSGDWSGTDPLKQFCAGNSCGSNNYYVNSIGLFCVKNSINDPTFSDCASSPVCVDGNGDSTNCFSGGTQNNATNLRCNKCVSPNLMTCSGQSTMGCFTSGKNTCNFTIPSCKTSNGVDKCTECRAGYDLVQNGCYKSIPNCIDRGDDLERLQYCKRCANGYFLANDSGMPMAIDATACKTYILSPKLIKSLPQSSLASLILIRELGTLISTDAIASINSLPTDSAKNYNPYSLFASTSGASLTFKDKFNVNSFQSLMGVVFGKDKFKMGFFANWGGGSYTTHANGNGNLKNIGGGMVSNYYFKGNRHYLEGSVYGGVITNTFDLGNVYITNYDELIGNPTIDVGYKLSSSYYGGHLGYGYILPLDEENKNNIEIYLKLLLSMVQGDTMTLANGDIMVLNDTKSTQIVFGTKYKQEFYNSEQYINKRGKQVGDKLIMSWFVNTYMNYELTAKSQSNIQGKRCIDANGHDNPNCYNNSDAYIQPFNLDSDEISLINSIMGNLELGITSTLNDNLNLSASTTYSFGAKGNSLRGTLGLKYAFGDEKSIAYSFETKLKNYERFERCWMRMGGNNELDVWEKWDGCWMGNGSTDETMKIIDDGNGTIEYGSRTEAEIRQEKLERNIEKSNETSKNNKQYDKCYITKNGKREKMDGCYLMK